MKTLVLAFMLIAATAQAEAPTAAEDLAAINAVLDASTAAWNNGDIPGFMESYWQSESLRFASGGDINFGWTPVLNRYLSRYPDDKAMGQLNFEDPDVRLLGPDHAMVFGTWRLIREADEPHGLYTLILQRLPEGWRIVHDHTSSASE
ncbi:MAG: ketosteroid isomerase-like protein [Candidatus Krumholzibacteriia bacterium]|jgi:ketosteroid isomerase-like protein